MNSTAYLKELANFETLALIYSKKVNRSSPSVSTISHCDYVIFCKDKILFIEETQLSYKDLFKIGIYTGEIIENIKKMWGSFAIFLGYIFENNLLSELEGKERYYVLLVDKLDGRIIRALSNLLKFLRKYRNGAYSDVKVHTKEDVKPLECLYKVIYETKDK